MTHPTLSAEISTAFHDAAKSAAVRVGIDPDSAQLAEGVDRALARLHTLTILLRSGARVRFEASLSYCLAFEAELMKASQQGAAWFSNSNGLLTVCPSAVEAFIRAPVEAAAGASASPD